MGFGLGKTLNDELSDDLCDSFFSLNIDEASTDTQKKRLTFLVSYFSTENQKVVGKHLASVNMLSVPSEAIFDETVHLFTEGHLQFSHVMSVLLDACNVMRGCNSEVEVRSRIGPASHLLDINWDLLHHVHNSAKQFTKCFNHYTEKLIFDACEDMTWSPDLVKSQEEITQMLGSHYTMSTRWLSVHDATNDLLLKYDMYTLFFYAFMSAANKVLYFLKCRRSQGRRSKGGRGG